MAKSPFSKSSSKPGHGEVHLAILPPNIPTFRTLNYTYPLKLVSSTPHLLQPLSKDGKETVSKGGNGVVPGNAPSRLSNVPLLFLLSYGGGLLPPDSISLSLTLEPTTRLTITTQGSTKIFPSKAQSDSSLKPLTASQSLTADLKPHSALLLSPEPTQPFKDSHYVQTQIFHVHSTASLCLLDWVFEGRRARGESWHAGSWRGRNEVWREGEAGTKRLLLRDSVILSDGPDGVGQSSLRAEGKGVFGTVIMLGSVFEDIGKFFVEEFGKLPRVGGRDWGDEKELKLVGKELEREEWRRKRVAKEKEDGVLWTATTVRGLVLVKFGSREVEGARQWLADMWKFEGTISREFGEGGLMSVR